MAPLNPRPRSYAEHSAGPLAAKPANDNVLGGWENGVFRFASPEAREKWKRKSYEQGVGEETWYLGQEIDAQSAAITQSGLGGAHAGIYQAPDGTYRRMNSKTIENQEARDHRSKYLSGKTIDQIAAMTSMPGANEWVAKGKAAQGAANDNADDVKSAPVAAPPATSQTVPPKTNLQTDAGTGRMIGGRFAAMQEALKSADVQDAKDIARIATNSIVGNYGDEVRAGLGAAGAFLEGKPFGDAYDSNLLKEKSESAAAQERQGLTGTGVELLTSFIPIVGDASGALADFKDWKEHGDDWGWEDYGLVALGLVPEMPNRKAVKGAEKIGGELLEAAGEAGDEVADLSKKSSNFGQVAKADSIDHRAVLEETKKKVYSNKEARRLETENRGLMYVQSNLQGNERARAHQSGGEGAFSDIESKKYADPALRYDNPNPRGLNFIRFDSAYVPEGQNYTMLVDSKTKLAIWSKKTQKRTLATMERAKLAVQQNPDHKLMYEFDTEAAAEEAQIFIRDNRYSAYLQAGVRKP
ncbi:MAG: hypothetical protein HYU58_02845 [Proteobacteria bacterium]|nr:hypothetical protein [Pseudomonadota bacterium]